MFVIDIMESLNIGLITIGKSGCGKSSLVEKLQERYGNNIELFHIDDPKFTRRRFVTDLGIMPYQDFELFRNAITKSNSPIILVEGCFFDARDQEDVKYNNFREWHGLKFNTPRDICAQRKPDNYEPYNHFDRYPTKVAQHLNVIELEEPLEKRLEQVTQMIDEKISNEIQKKNICSFAESHNLFI